MNLTDDQKIKVTDLLVKAEKDSEPAVMAQKKAAEDFVTLLGKQDASEKDLRAAAISAESAEQALIMEKIKTLMALRALLTSGQNEALSKWLDRWTAQWKPMPQPLLPAPMPVSPATK